VDKKCRTHEPEDLRRKYHKRPSYIQKKMGHRSITSTTIYEDREPNQDVETYTVKAVRTREEAEKHSLGL
jgi:hypothetical protein